LDGPLACAYVSFCTLRASSVPFVPALYPSCQTYVLVLVVPFRPASLQPVGFVRFVSYHRGQCSAAKCALVLYNLVPWETGQYRLSFNLGCPVSYGAYLYSLFRRSPLQLTNLDAHCPGSAHPTGQDSEANQCTSIPKRSSAIAVRHDVTFSTVHTRSTAGRSYPAMFFTAPRHPHSLVSGTGFA
jgi:hypothetical protein